MTARRPLAIIGGSLTDVPDADTLYVAPLGSSQDLPACAGTQSTDSTGVYSVGSLVFDPSLYPTTQGNTTRTIVLRALAFATPSMTAEVSLYNVTDGSPVASATVTTSANSITTLTSGTLVVPTDLPNSSKLYDVRLRISAGTPGPTDAAIVHWAGLQVIYS